MDRLENEFETISSSHCRVGRIIPKIYEENESNLLIDFKLEDFKRSIDDFVKE